MSDDGTKVVGMPSEFVYLHANDDRDDLTGLLTRGAFALRVAEAAEYGRDLGADVTLVGPGAAYERWKESAEYKTWLLEIGKNQDRR